MRPTFDSICNMAQSIGACYNAMWNPLMQKISIETSAPHVSQYTFARSSTALFQSRDAIVSKIATAFSSMLARTDKPFPPTAVKEVGNDGSRNRAMDPLRSSRKQEYRAISIRCDTNAHGIGNWTLYVAAEQNAHEIDRSSISNSFWLQDIEADALLAFLRL